MDCEIGETLFGWKITSPEGEFQSFALTTEEKTHCISLLSKYFSLPASSKSTPADLLKWKCESTLSPISQQSFDKIIATCVALLNSVGPVDVLLGQDAEEVFLSIGKARIFISGKGWIETPLEINTAEFLFHVVNKLAKQCGRRITRENPILNAFLPNGNRIHAVCPPLAPNLQVSIRKFRQMPFSLTELADSNILTSKAAEFLREAVSTSSIIVAGNTGSGKTTTLNALLSLLPKNDRFVFVEDVTELTLPSHEHKARLLAENVSLSSLIYESLRMRPDRLVVSEVRNEPEVKAFANALLSGGGKTCYSTFHAQTATECLRRLELLGFRKTDLDSIGLIVVQKRFDDKNGKETRKVTEIARVKNGEPVVLFRYNEKKDCLMPSLKTRNVYLPRFP